MYQNHSSADIYISHLNGHFSLRYVKCQIWLIIKMTTGLFEEILKMRLFFIEKKMYQLRWRIIAKYIRRDLKFLLNIIVSL